MLAGCCGLRWRYIDGLSALTRYVSLGSMVGVVASFLMILILTILGYHPAQYPVEYLIYTGIAASLIVFQHRDNIKRLWSGTERKLGEKSETLVDARERDG